MLSCNSCDRTPPEGKTLDGLDAIGRGPAAIVLCLPICMAFGWLVTVLSGTGGLDSMGNPIGGDFAMFYIAGQMAGSGQWNDLYNEPLQQSMLRELFPGIASDSYLPFRYPPMVACAMAPMALLPYRASFIVFSMLSLAAWLGSLGFLVRTAFPRSFWTTRSESFLLVLAIAVSPVILQTLMDGQASAFWFAIATGCWCMLRRDRFVAAGCLLALAACKPNVLALLSITLLLRYPKMLFGLLPTGIALLAATWLAVGTDCLDAYRQLSQHLALRPWDVETPYWKVQSLLSWSELFLGPTARSINLAIGVIAATCIGILWRGVTMRSHDSNANPRWLCAALVVNGLFNPYTPVYDLVLLGLGMIACLAEAENKGIAAKCLARRDVQISALSLLFGPVLSQSLSHAWCSPLQLMPIALLAISLYWARFLIKNRTDEKSFVAPSVRPVVT